MQSAFRKVLIGLLFLTSVEIGLRDSRALAEEAPAPSAIVPPVVDTIQVEPSGVVLVAGSAGPGSRVAILEGAIVIGTAVADAGGAFALALDAPLAPGDHEIGVRATSADGSVVLLADRHVPVTVPPAAVASATGTPPPLPASPHPPATPTTQANADAPGPNGRPPPSPAALPATVTVQDGDSLWSIAEATLGDASAWPRIYRANRNRIANPARIYPGQVLDLPR